MFGRRLGRHVEWALEAWRACYPPAGRRKRSAAEAALEAGEDPA
jgi:hypothetical protein